MTLEFTLLRTRVARKILGLFLLCAATPIVVFAALSYRKVHDGLTEQARKDLKDESKMSAMVVLDELNGLGSSLGTVALGRSPGAVVGDSGSFQGVARQRADGAVSLLAGTRFVPPVLAGGERAHLARDLPLLARSGVGEEPALYIGVQSGSDVIWGRMLLSRFEDAIEPAAGSDQLCIVDHDGRSVTCPDEAQRKVVARLGAQPGSSDIWEYDGEEVLTAHASAFLIPRFGAMPWTIALTKPLATALGPLADFRKTFILGVVLAVILVFTVSHVQIRRRMSPLADLEDGTRRLQDGDFTSRVVVTSDDEFSTLATSFNRMADELQRQFETLAAFHAVDSAALEGQSSGAMAAAVLERTCALLGATHIGLAVATLDDERWCYHGASIGEAPATEAIHPSADDLLQLLGDADHLTFATGMSAPSYCRLPVTHGGECVVFPILRNGAPLAVLVVSGTDNNGAPERSVALGRQLADRFALGLANAHMLQELHALSVGSLTALARTIDAASPWTGGHSERVTQCAVEIARRMGLSDEDRTRLHHGGLLHDIGKIGIPVAILDKPGRLSEAELVVMQSHPVIGAEIVQTVRAFRDFVPLVMHHHELLDGTGYPHGLSGDQIPTLVRILTVADVYDALASDRPYRAGLDASAAMAILLDGIGRKFDPVAVATLEVMIAEGWQAGVSGSPSGRISAPAKASEVVWEETFV